MAINSGPINGYAINAASSANVDETVSESVQLSPGVIGLRNALIEVAEKLQILPTDTYGGIYNHGISDTFNMIDTLLVIFNDAITDNVQTVESISSNITLINAILENLYVEETKAGNADYNSTLVESFALVDDISFGILKIISETLGIADGLTVDFSAMAIIIDQVLLSETIVSIQSVFNALEEQIGLADSIANAANLSDIVSDIIYLAINTAKDKDYLSYLLSPETSSVSTYTNYNFTGSCVFNDEPLFINNSGLFKYGGDTDNGANIEAVIQTAAMSFGTPHLKRVLNLYLGLYNSDKLVLKASADGGTTAYYEIKQPTENLQTQRITLGKGLVGRYWQFELVTEDNAIFELESLDFLPISLSRRV